MPFRKFIFTCILCFTKALYIQSTEQLHYEIAPPESLGCKNEKRLNSEETPLFYIDRGESFLATGQFDKALDDLHRGYQLNLTIKTHPFQQKLELRSLFGIMLACICLEKEDQACRVSGYLQHSLDSWECEDCLEAKKCHDEDYVIGPNKEPYDGWCEETIITTAATLKGVVKGSRINSAARESLIFTIEKFQDQALTCCAKGGLWKACVGPLAKKLYQWKILGIPPDPSWD